MFSTSFCTISTSTGRTRPKEIPTKTPDAAQKTATPAVAHLPQFSFADKRKVSEQETELVILPDPVGYHMLIALPTMAQMTAKGVFIPDIVNERERAATVMGTVLAMGSMCYKDHKKFGWYDPATDRTEVTPWCKVGDTVLFSRYSGMRFKSKDKESGDMVEYRMLSDDQVVGTVPDGAEVAGL